MTEFAIELIPRDLAEFETKSQLITSIYSNISIVNIPDLVKLDNRSWDAAIAIKKHCKTVIPHLRAMDFDLYSGFKIADKLLSNGVNELLIVSGDIPEDNSNINQTTAIQMIKYLKSHYPEFKLYAAVDPYRGSFQEETRYIQEKIDVGVDGFFTQPFFDLDMLKLYLNFLKDENVFFGISPVTSDRSRIYWEKVNKVVFPRDFNPCLDDNARFAKKAVELIKQYQKNIYFMPIKEDECEYLGKVFS